MIPEQRRYEIAPPYPWRLQGKRVKPFSVACSRKGDVFIVTHSGQVVAV